MENLTRAGHHPTEAAEHRAHWTSGIVRLSKRFHASAVIGSAGFISARHLPVTQNRWKAFMQIDFIFRIKEIGVRKWHVIAALVDVPKNWDELDDWEKREYLTKPDGYSPNYHAVISWASSRFEKICNSHNIFGLVADFKYTPSNKACTRQGQVAPQFDNFE